jgi:hypothetical protein
VPWLSVPIPPILRPPQLLGHPGLIRCQFLAERRNEGPGTGAGPGFREWSGGSISAPSPEMAAALFLYGVRTGSMRSPFSQRRADD